jgi:phosphatidylethanolamine-binding protein (PEBP) family uncharacterized protein
MRRPPLSLLAVAIGFAVLVGAGRANAFELHLSWAGITACEQISPEFHLSDVPAGTRRLHFEMYDLNVPAYRHGGSTVSYESDTVRRGAIHYVGPCPPNGKHHRYRWTVEALNAVGKVLGTATAMETFPP